jgi:hypothetical protein
MCVTDGCVAAAGRVGLWTKGEEGHARARGCANSTGPLGNESGEGRRARARRAKWAEQAEGDGWASLVFLFISKFLIHFLFIFSSELN